MTDLDFGGEPAATFSDCGKFRYTLSRTIGPGPLRHGWIMLNPSTADATTDDPTIRRCIGFSRRECAASLVVTNLFAFRATDPRDLKAAKYPVGPENDHHIGKLLETCHLVIAAWGAHAPDWRVREVVKLAGGSPLWCIGRTSKGQPRHPLMVKADQPLERWP